MSTELTLLFVDDEEILYRPGTRRRLQRPARHPANPLIKDGERPWDDHVAYNSVYHDQQSGRYQLWYQCSGRRLARDKRLRVLVCYAESADGIHWVKPDLGVTPFNEIRNTNIVLCGNGGYSTNYGASVLVDPRDPDPVRRYKMAYWDFAVDEGQEHPGLCVAFSPDGIHWTKHPQAPVIRGGYGDEVDPPYEDERQPSSPGRWDVPLGFSDVVDAAYDPQRDCYMIYAKTWSDGPNGRMSWKRAVVRTDSHDFVHWTRPQLVMVPDEFDDTHVMDALRTPLRPERNPGRGGIGVELHSGPAFYYNGLYFSLLQVLDLDSSGYMPTELAISRDGYRWQRPFRQDFFLPPSPGYGFDSGVLWTNSTPIIHPDEIWFYHGAYCDWDADLYGGATGIGLAILPRDRFAGLRPVAQVGQITLRPRDLSLCRRITLNADAHAGAVRVEVLNAAGCRLRGFAKQDALPIVGDGLRHEVRWSGRTLGELPPGEYSLRVHLEDAEVFALTLYES